MIFNELKYVEEMLKNGFLQTKYLLELKLLAKYLNKVEGLTKNKIKIRLKEFCKENWTKYNEVKCLSIVQKATNYGINNSNQLFTAEKINIYQSELDHIKSLQDIKLERLAFSFLVLSKVNRYRRNFYIKIKEDIQNKKDINKEKKTGIKINRELSKINEKYYINSISESLKYAKVSIKKSIQSDYIKILSDKKLIKLTMVGSIEVLFVEVSNNNIIFSIDLSDNFIYEYLKYIGLYKSCEKCNKPISPTNNKNKYCKECAKEVKMELDRLRMKNLRNKSKIENP
jgi:hypothetical protein